MTGNEVFDDETCLRVVEHELEMLRTARKNRSYGMASLYAAALRKGAARCLHRGLISEERSDELYDISVGKKS